MHTVESTSEVHLVYSDKFGQSVPATTYTIISNVILIKSGRILINENLYFIHKPVMISKVAQPVSELEVPIFEAPIEL